MHKAESFGMSKKRSKKLPASAPAAEPAVPLKNGLPVSSVTLWPQCAGVLLFIAALLWLRADGDLTSMTLQGCVLLAGLAALPHILYEYLRADRPGNSGVICNPRVKVRPFSAERVFTKCAGLALTLISARLLYALLPEYAEQKYAPFLELVDKAALYFIPAAIAYIAFTDARDPQEEDGLTHAGHLALLRFGKVNKKTLGAYARNWAVKWFFLPLMCAFIVGNINYLLKFDASLLSGTAPAPLNAKHWFDFLYNCAYTLDLLFALSGYMLTLRLLNTEIRSSEPTPGGWFICVMCYPPLWQGVFSAKYFAYDNGHFWGNWLWDSPVIYGLWAAAIIFLLFVYGFATVTAGIRFSNLTYRGLWSAGLYRFTKHPAYLAKNISWWLISVPFISTAGIGEALADCTMLAGVNIIYYLRARTEERHLSAYPEYRAYALAMNNRGITGVINAFLPGMRYRTPAAE